MTAEVVIGETGPDGVMNIAMLPIEEDQQVSICEFGESANGETLVLKMSIGTFRLRRADLEDFIRTMEVIAIFLRSRL